VIVSVRETAPDSAWDSDADADSDTETDTDTDTGTDTDTDTDTALVIERIGVLLEAAYDPETDTLRGFVDGGWAAPFLDVGLKGTQDGGCSFVFSPKNGASIPFSVVEERSFSGELFIDLNQNGEEDQGARSNWDTNMWVLTLNDDWELTQQRCYGELDTSVWGEDPERTLRDLNVGVGFGGDLAPVMEANLKRSGEDPRKYKNTWVQLEAREPSCQGAVLSSLLAPDPSCNVI